MVPGTAWYWVLAIHNDKLSMCSRWRHLWRDHCMLAALCNLLAFTSACAVPEEESIGVPSAVLLWTWCWKSASMLVVTVWWVIIWQWWSCERWKTAPLDVSYSLILQSTFQVHQTTAGGVVVGILVWVIATYYCLCGTGIGPLSISKSAMVDSERGQFFHIGICRVM